MLVFIACTPVSKLHTMYSVYSHAHRLTSACVQACCVETHGRRELGGARSSCEENHHFRSCELILGDPGADSGREGKSERARKKPAKKSLGRGFFVARLDFPLAPTVCPWVSEDDASSAPLASPTPRPLFYSSACYASYSHSGPLVTKHRRNLFARFFACIYHDIDGWVNEINAGLISVSWRKVGTSR